MYSRKVITVRHILDLLNHSQNNFKHQLLNAHLLPVLSGQAYELCEVVLITNYNKQNIALFCISVKNANDTTR